MSLGLRAAALRTALEAATGESVSIQPTPSGIRLSVTAPDPQSPLWPCVLEVLGRADVWGSSGTAASPHIWAALVEQ